MPPQHEAQLHTDFSCNTFMMSLQNSSHPPLCEYRKDIMAIQKCCFMPSVVEAIWETLS